MSSTTEHLSDGAEWDILMTLESVPRSYFHELRQVLTLSAPSDIGLTSHFSDMILINSPDTLDMVVRSLKAALKNARGAQQLHSVTHTCSVNGLSIEALQDIFGSLLIQSLSTNPLVEIEDMGTRTEDVLTTSLTNNALAFGLVSSRWYQIKDAVGDTHSSDGPETYYTHIYTPQDPDRIRCIYRIEKSRTWNAGLMHYNDDGGATIAALRTGAHAEVSLKDLAIYIDPINRGRSYSRTSFKFTSERLNSLAISGIHDMNFIPICNESVSRSLTHLFLSFLPETSMTMNGLATRIFRAHRLQVLHIGGLRTPFEPESQSPPTLRPSFHHDSLPSLLSLTLTHYIPESLKLFSEIDVLSCQARVRLDHSTSDFTPTSVSYLESILHRMNGIKKLYVQQIDEESGLQVVFSTSEGSWVWMSESATCKLIPTTHPILSKIREFGITSCYIHLPSFNTPQLYNLLDTAHSLKELHVKITGKSYTHNASQISNAMKALQHALTHDSSRNGQPARICPDLSFLSISFNTPSLQIAMEMHYYDLASIVRHRRLDKLRVGLIIPNDVENPLSDCTQLLNEHRPVLAGLLPPRITLELNIFSSGMSDFEEWGDEQQRAQGDEAYWSYGWKQPQQ